MIKKILIILASIVAVILVYSSAVYQGAFEGQVLNAVTKEPIKNLDIYYTYHLTKPCISIDTCPRYVAKEFKINTDQNGNYLIPSFFLFKVPFSFDPQISIWFPTGDERYKTHFAEEYLFEVRSTTDSLERYANIEKSEGYPSDIKLSFSKQKLDILLVPKLEDSIEQCNLIKETYPRIKCISLNSWDIAINKGNLSLCDNLDEIQLVDNTEVEQQPCKREICTESFTASDQDKLECKNIVYEKLAVRELNASYCYNINKGGCPGCYPKEMYINECIEAVGRFANLS